MSVTSVTNEKRAAGSWSVVRDKSADSFHHFPCARDIFLLCGEPLSIPFKDWKGKI